MPLLPLVTGVLETALNALLAKNAEAKNKLPRLRGKVLALQLRELPAPLVFVFSNRIDVLAAWEDEADCRVRTGVLVLPELRDRSQVTRLIREQALDVQGDIQVLQHFVALMEALGWDPAELLAPYTGDLVAHGVSCLVQGTVAGVQRQHARNLAYLGEVVTEEWRLAPGALEVAYFADQVEELATQLTRLERRLQRLETSA
ncbi:MAG: ubiquinone biosynthesis accessory factor UbiJ [Plesiomonas shigelloides]